LEYFKGSRIFFGPCGIGLGHVSRNIPIANELKRKGAEVVFSTYLESIRYARRNGFKVVEAPALSLINDVSGSIDLRSSLKQILKSVPIFSNQVEFELKCMRSFSPDVVVSDSRLSTILAAKMLGKPVILILNQFNPIVPREKDAFMAFKLADGTIMTLLGKGWSLCNEILIPDFPEPYTLSTDTLRIPKNYRRKISLIGAILSKKLEDNIHKEAIIKEFEVKQEQKLIYAGISGPKQERLPLLQMLESALSDFFDDYKIVMSLGDPLKKSEKTLTGSLIKISWIEDRFEYLNACDAVISRGGHETLMQSICYKKPSLIIPVPNHPEQYSNARKAQQLGVARAIHQKDITRLLIKELLDEITIKESYKQNLNNLNKYGHVDEGLDKSIEIISKYLKN
jgi:UDP-N-acetylglucosamine--N-acetylmuramyl-(pentapeptide) pyrophosphoryl-undecaprenol N-acetylglucosamine transferase